MDLEQESNGYVSGFMLWTLRDAHVINFQPLFGVMQIQGLLDRVDKKVIGKKQREQKRISDAGHIFMHKRMTFPG